MAGNVWELCSSQYRGYPYRADDGRENLEKGANRVLRGGSHYDNPGLVRCGYRLNLHPGNGIRIIGFRVARGPLS